MNVQKIKGTCRRSIQCLAICLLAVITGCMNLSTPTDYLLNLGTFPHTPALEAAEDGIRRIVVLKHGIGRSAASLWKMERALRDHGYEVVNNSYKGADHGIEELGHQMGEEIEQYLQGSNSDSRKVALCFVGHSMGGLVIRSYLSGDAAREAEACVFIATPHRGAVLQRKYVNAFWFTKVMGNRSGLELRPGDPFYDTLRRMTCDCGVIYGGWGDGEGWSDFIPGDDDSRVGVDEAQLPEAKDSVFYKRGHTLIGFADATIYQVLHFLKHRKFEPRDQGQRYSGQL